MESVGIKATSWESVRGLWIVVTCWEGTPDSFHVFETKEAAIRKRDKLIQDHGFNDYKDWKKQYAMGKAPVEYFIFESS